MSEKKLIIKQGLEQQVLEEKTKSYEEKSARHLERAKKYQIMYEQEIEKTRLAEEKARQAEVKAKQYQEKATVMEEGIRKFLTATSWQQRKVQEMETELDSIESTETDL